VEILLDGKVISTGTAPDDVNFTALAEICEAAPGEWTSCKP
jgi:hypothetical protein